MRKGPFIFDSYALLKLFQKEKRCEKIYSTKREFGNQKKIEVLASIERLNFIILSVSNNLIFQAAEHKAQYSISYADCFVLASAIEHKAVVVTGDPEFKKVEQLVEIF